MKPFWASTKNKEKYQTPSRNIFQRMSENDSTKIVLSGNVTGGKGHVLSALMVNFLNVMTWNQILST